MLGTEYEAFSIYKSKGLLAHLINRKHFVAAKYIDYLPDIIRQPDYIGILRQLDFERTQFEKPMEQYSEGQKKK